MEGKAAVVEDLVHREIFLEDLGVHDPDAEVPCEFQACLEEKATECSLLPFIRYDDSVFGLASISAFDEAGDCNKVAFPLLDGFRDNRNFLIRVYVAETPGIFGGGAEG